MEQGRESVTPKLFIIALAGALGALIPYSAAAQFPNYDLPDGEGKELVEANCTACHPAIIFDYYGSGYKADGWRELIATMIDLSDRPGDHAAIIDYMAAHFPPRPERAPVLVPGEARIAFKEWVVPTLGQRARDPIEAPDGSIWWAGQVGNLIGRIDPKTGAMKEYPLPAGSMPHSVIPDDAGNIWYMGNKNATIGKLDPKTEKITVYKMPIPGAKDPHSAVFGQDGIMWFTLQQSNMVGRLDPATGDIKLVTMKTPGSKPYGIKIDAQGAPWVACNGSNCLVKVDPKTMALSEIKLPHPATTVRRLDFDDDGVIWYVNSSRGRLGRFDPRTGEIKEWPSPSGPKSHPYAIAVIDGIVWYNESGKRPDALVRFDPKTEAFQSWPIPSGNIYAGIVRHVWPTRDGNLLIHQGSTNRIILVTLDPPQAQ